MLRAGRDSELRDHSSLAARLRLLAPTGRTLPEGAWVHRHHQALHDPLTGPGYRDRRRLVADLEEREREAAVVVDLAERPLDRPGSGA
jgi:hypothetical protein